MTTPRADVISTWLEAWAAVRSSRYQVVRGFVDFNAWSFDSNPYLVAIVFSEDTIINRMPAWPGSYVPQPATMRTWVIGRVTNPTPVANKRWLVSDTSIDEFYHDLQSVIDVALADTDAEGRSTIAQTDQDKLEEIYDAESQLTGIRYDLTFRY